MIAPASPAKPAGRLRKRKPSAVTPTKPGVIEPGSLYTADEARTRLRVGDWAWRQMRRQGLRVLRVAGRAYVLGSDVITFFEQHGAPTDPESADQRATQCHSASDVTENVT